MIFIRSLAYVLFVIRGVRYGLGTAVFRYRYACFEVDIKSPEQFIASRAFQPFLPPLFAANASSCSIACFHVHEYTALRDNIATCPPLLLVSFPPRKEARRAPSLPQLSFSNASKAAVLAFVSLFRPIFCQQLPTASSYPFDFPDRCQCKRRAIVRIFRILLLVSCSMVRIVVAP